MPLDVTLARGAIERIRRADLTAASGRVTRVMPTFLEADGPHAPVGTVCEISANDHGPTLAEIVGIDQQRVALMPYASVHGVMVGDRVQTRMKSSLVAVGEGFLGRAVNAMGEPIDGGVPVLASDERPLHGTYVSPLNKVGASHPLDTGIRAIDALLTLGVGQRVGIFAGSGVGKTTLLNCLAQHVVADVRVICLVGERGREAEEFWNKVLTPEQRERSVQVVSTSDESAIVRARAVYFALTLAEHFRAQGKHVLFVLDSMTRLAMALREIGLAVGEPPTVRAYTPSVFSVLPRVIERFGALKGAGAITALVSVLTETDDTDDPLAETVKALLDGHIVLSRELAERGQLPAINVQRSVSRFFRAVTVETQRTLVTEAIGQLSVYDSSRSLVESGMYKAGTNPSLDRALQCREHLLAFLRQPPEQRVTRQRAIEELAVAIEEGRRGAR
jgi:flagellum-specific ATP synthase